ncbi:ribonuclease H-like domain-containing protein [Tanacetum coccineum]
MDLETAQTNSTIKLPLLKQGEYDMWNLRIEQYFQVQDYALWDVIENGNSFKPAAQPTTNADGSSTTLIPGLVTVDEKTQKKNDVKTRSMLLMALPNEHLLTFNQYKNAKTLFAAIQTRFVEDYESVGYPWNKPDIDTMSFDDLYNNFKIVKQEVNGTASSSSSSQNLAFMSSTSSTNEVNTAYGVSTANTQASTVSTQVSTANLSDDTVYAFLAVTLKDPTSTMGGTTHYKVFQDEKHGYTKFIKVGYVLILRNVSVWTPTPSQHYLNITIKNIVKVFDKDTEF